MRRHYSSRSARARSALVAGGLVLGFIACHDSLSPIPPPPPGVSISLGTSSLLIVRGQTLTLPVTLVRKGGYAGDVSLAVAGVPSGVVATFEPANLVSGSSTSLLTFAAAKTTEPGGYPLTISSSAADIDDASGEFYLVVTSTWPEGAVALSPWFDQFSMVEGQQGAIDIDVARPEGFPDDVRLAISGLPEGVTATFDPAVVAPGSASSRLRIQTSPTTAGGPYHLVITGGTDDVAITPVTIDLTVVSGPAPPFSVWIAGGIDGIVIDRLLPSFPVMADPFFITVTRTPDYDGTVELSVEGLPAGVAFSFEPRMLYANQAVSLVTISVAANASNGAGQATIRGRGVGVPDATQVLRVNVNVF